MSDARWEDVGRAARDAVQHFGRSIRFVEGGETDVNRLDPYWAGMAFMHSMQTGHTSLEGSLLRVFDILGEQQPTGEQWHKDLIDRACQAVEGPHARPPILSEELCRAIDETRRFRDVATRGYDRFDAERARPAILAARLIVDRFVPELLRFRSLRDGN